MLKRCRGKIIVIIAMTIFCVPFSPDRDRPADFPHSGMKKVLSAGKSFYQGWSGSYASYDERPGMQTSFTYDYWLDTTEVTQKRYYEVTGKQPIAAGSRYGMGDNYPIYNVSWFDAVLYCNARSRTEGLDTVYVYSGTKTLSNGTVYDLTGLRYDFTRDGYRLPTEAEWEYAAREASSALPFTAAADSAYACYYAWYGENSSNKTHPVGSRLPNSLGLYDMAGNVFEWTNDWKCMYDGKGITNSLGAYQPGREYEKVIKGGSYNYPQMYLRPSHRSATYATMLSSANEYVGFRCARGSIPNGQYIGVGQTTFTPNAVTIMTSESDLRSFIGTSETKLVFVNVSGPNRTLCYVDFNRTFPYVQEYLDDRDVYMPVISPDGRYVAYCSRNEGQSGPSKISIRSLDSLKSPIEQLASDTAYIPRWWWIDPRNAYIIYTNSAVPNDNIMWKSTKTFLQMMSGGVAVDNPFEWINNGSYHDGISVNGRYAVTGFTRLLRRDLGTGIDTQLFVSPDNGKDADGLDQVCNVSISPDTGSGVRCLFLDFGYPRTSTVTGTSYGIHQYLFVSNMSGVITNFMNCPSGEQSWDYTEWTNQPKFGVGCGKNNIGQSHAVYAIDLDHRNFKQLLTGTELQQPYLWIGFLVPNPSDFALDSIGRYNEPPGDAHPATKLLMIWRLTDSIEVAIIGSSLTWTDINPAMINGLKAFNFAAMAFDLLGQKNFILHYLKHCPHIKVICSSFDIFWIDNQDGNYTWKIYVGQSKGYLYDSSHAFWPGGVSREFKNIICQIPLPNPFDTLNRGFYWASPSAGPGWGADPPPFNPNSITWTTADTFYQQNLATIIMLADTLRSRGIHWIMINCPESPNYRHVDSYTLAGPSWTTAGSIIQDMRGLERSNTFFHFYDANMDGNHDYGPEDGCDEDHLSGQGAAKLTARVDSIIHTILP